MKETVYTLLTRCSYMSYEQNPYGPSIPAVFLYAPELVKPPLTPDAPRCLADLMQDGNSISYVVNDVSKRSKAENIDCVIFTEIFHQLYDEGTLCPANYVRVIIDKLDAYNASALVKLTFADYIGIISRGLRAFASYIREVHLFSLIKQYLWESGKYHYEVFEPNSEVDTKEKTDIMFRIGPKLYRVWSYQNSPSGVEKTSYRITKGCSSGYNILLPFDRLKHYCVFELHGWHLYNKRYLFNVLDELFRRRANDYDNVLYRIRTYGDYAAIPQIFYVP